MSDLQTPEEQRRRITELAYSIWESEGRPDGQADRHWKKAEKLLDAHSRIQARADEPASE